MSLLTALCDILTRAAKLLIGTLIAAIVLITLAAVWWRYVLNAPLAWPEQISRIFFVWTTFVGAAVLYRERLHVAIDMFVLMLPKRLQVAAVWLVEILLLVFNVALLVYGLQLSLNTLGQTYGALDISPATFYFAAPVSAAMMLLYFLERLIQARTRGIDTSHLAPVETGPPSIGTGA